MCVRLDDGDEAVNEITKYEKPYPQMTDLLGGTEEPSCTANNGPWRCTRRPGHEGRHEAGDMLDQMYASWPQS